jgi:hypothetical protein
LFVLLTSTDGNVDVSKKIYKANAFLKAIIWGLFLKRNIFFLEVIDLAVCLLLLNMLS